MSDEHIGLSSTESKQRHLEYGPNEIVPSKLESRFAEIKRILLDPMGLMLLFVALLHAFLGEKIDALILFLAYVPITAVDVILDLKSRKALQSLKATIQSSAKVMRDGQLRNVPVRELVPGDILVFEEGQSLPADGQVLEAHELAINESALTGESVPVDKVKDATFWGGTTILRGRGFGLVEKIGTKTRFGKIARLMQETESDESPLQKKIDVIVKQILWIALVLVAALFVLEYIKTGLLVKSLVVALTFGIAAVPEEFPLVFTLYLSLGAWRLSKHGVLVKSLPRVETLGSVNVICTDKTGTLTEGKFQMEDLVSLDPSIEPNTLWLCALMACEVTPVDTLESAIFEKGRDKIRLLNGWTLKWDYPFEIQGKHMSHVWMDKQSEHYIIAMKGAVEGVLEHCKVDTEQRANILNSVDDYASQGKRLLGLAYRNGPCTGDRSKDEQNLTFLGLMVFSDPIRASAREAIAACQQENIQIKMLTGDHPLTAHAVAEGTGIIHSHDYIYTGHQLAKMSPTERNTAYQKGAIFSRVLPEQKYEMVQALKKSGYVVAMTGDGINDAPALKLADIGISMGLNATDVARSSAQMVLLNNDFKGIVQAVFEGRKVFSNLKRTFSYLVSFNVPVVLLALVPPAVGKGVLFFTIHIVLLELIVHPVSAFVFENMPGVRGESQKGLIPKMTFIRSLLSGLLLSAGALLLFYAFQAPRGLDSARALALSTIFLGNIFLVLVSGWPHFTFRFWVTSLSLVALSIFSTTIPSIAKILHFGNLNAGDFLLAFGVGLLASVPSYLLKLYNSKKP